MRESEIERYLLKRCGWLNILCYKWISPGHIGVPDRILLADKNIVRFVELKSDIGHISPMQQREHVRLKMKGHDVYVLRSLSEVDVFLDQLRKEVKALKGKPKKPQPKPKPC